MLIFTDMAYYYGDTHPHDFHDVHDVLIDVLGLKHVLLLHKKIIRILAGVGYLEHSRTLFASLKFCTVINLYVFRFFNVQKLTYTYSKQDKIVIFTTHGADQQYAYLITNWQLQVKFVHNNYINFFNMLLE